MRARGGPTARCAVEPVAGGFTDRAGHGRADAHRGAEAGRDATRGDADPHPSLEPDRHCFDADTGRCADHHAVADRYGHPDAHTYNDAGPHRDTDGLRAVRGG